MRELIRMAHQLLTAIDADYLVRDLGRMAYYVHPSTYDRLMVERYEPVLWRQHGSGALQSAMFLDRMTGGLRLFGFDVAPDPAVGQNEIELRYAVRATLPPEQDAEGNNAP